jgi:hypothetical protein
MRAGHPAAYRTPTTQARGASGFPVGSGNYQLIVPWESISRTCDRFRAPGLLHPPPQPFAVLSRWCRIAEPPPPAFRQPNHYAHQRRLLTNIDLDPLPDEERPTLHFSISETNLKASIGVRLCVKIYSRLCGHSRMQHAGGDQHYAVASDMKSL